MQFNLSYCAGNIVYLMAYKTPFFFFFVKKISLHFISARFNFEAVASCKWPLNETLNKFAHVNKVMIASAPQKSALLCRTGST